MLMVVATIYYTLEGEKIFISTEDKVKSARKSDFMHIPLYAPFYYVLYYYCYIPIAYFNCIFMYTNKL